MPKNRTIYPGRSGSTGPVIYCIDMPEHPFGIGDAVAGLSANVVTVAVDDWDDALTPWPAPGLYRGDADFKGEARVTLSELVGTSATMGGLAAAAAGSAGGAIAQIEREEGLAPSKRAICGYSLGGLFSLYAFTSCGLFDAAACLSASVWYKGWLEHLRALDLADVAGKYAFFSIGSKERKANPPILHCVQNNMGQCAEILRAHGCAADFVVGPGDHVHYHEERFRRGLQALDEHLS